MRKILRDAACRIGTSCPRIEQAGDGFDIVGAHVPDEELAAHERKVHVPASLLPELSCLDIGDFDAWLRARRTAPGDMLPLVYDLDAVQREEELVLGEALAGFGEQFPDVSVQERVLQGGAAHTLITLSSEAQLVVVGTRGRGGFVGLMLGSVSHQVLHHTHCPVLIIPRKA